MDVHIDMSEKLHTEKTVGIAWCTEDQKTHKGLALAGSANKKLKRKKGDLEKNFARLYGVLAHIILRGNLTGVSRIIICNDERFSTVKEVLDILFADEDEYQDIEVISISKYRQEIEDAGMNPQGKKIISKADGLAESYRKRALKPARWNRGKKLNVVEMRVKELMELWDQIAEYAESEKKSAVLEQAKSEKKASEEL